MDSTEANGAVIRLADTSDLTSVAMLRWEWVLENEGTPVATRDEFVAFFVKWAAGHSSSHRCMVAVRNDEVIGMAWLAIVQRVPSPQALERASGDMQCVYVVPIERNTGIGGVMIASVRQLASELGLERVTVHSSSRSIPAYVRTGFAVSPKLLQAELAPPRS